LAVMLTWLKWSDCRRADRQTLWYRDAHLFLHYVHLRSASPRWDFWSSQKRFAVDCIPSTKSRRSQSRRCEKNETTSKQHNKQIKSPHCCHLQIITDFMFQITVSICQECMAAIEFFIVVVSHTITSVIFDRIHDQVMSSFVTSGLPK